MKLPQEVEIPKEKLVKYLLIFKDEDDKSKFLALADYTLSNWDVLERDLRQLAGNNEIVSVETSPFGTKYEVRGKLKGPNNKILHVITIWIKLDAAEKIRFVTLFPDREVGREHEQD